MLNEKNIRGLRMRQKEIVATASGSETIDVEDGGTMFMVSGTGAYTITLPLMSDAGPGWHCTFMCDGAVSSAAITIKPNGSESTQSLLALVEHDTNVGTSDVNADTVTFTTSASKGSYLYMFTDGNYWYVNGRAGASGTFGKT